MKQILKKIIYIFIVFTLGLFIFVSGPNANNILSNPVIPSAGGKIKIDQVNLKFFSGLPITGLDLQSLSPAYKTKIGSGFVMRENMLRTISGKVQNENGDAIPDVTIEVRLKYNTDKRLIVYSITNTDINGYYSLDRLPAKDDYNVVAYPKNDTPYQAQFYPDKLKWESADSLSTLPGNLENIDFTLHESPQNGIAGQILDSQNLGISGAIVAIWSDSIGISMTTLTDSNGNYSFNGITPSDDYRIAVWSNQYQTTCYYVSSTVVSTDIEKANPIDISDSLLTGINIVISPDIIIYYIDASASENGNISPSGHIPVPYNKDQDFYFIPNQGAIVTNVLVDGVSYSAITNYSFKSVIRQGHTIKVEFGFPTITATSDSNGKIEPSGNIQLSAGTNQTFKITPNDGYEIEKVFVDDNPIGAISEYTFSDIRKNHVISVTFKKLESFQITLNINPGGSITIQENQNSQLTVTSNNSPYTASVLKGHSLTIRLYPDAGYYINSIALNGESQGKIKTYILSDVQNNHSFSALFEKISISATSEGKGSITPSGIVDLTEGQNKTFNIKPDSGHYLKTLLVDDKPVTLTSSYTFWKVSAKHSIKAVFEELTPVIFSISINEGGSVTAIGYDGKAINTTSVPSAYTISVVPSTSLFINIAPSNGYGVSNVAVDGNSEGAILQKNFSTVSSDHSIDVNFIKIPLQTITASAQNGGKITPSGLITLTQWQSKLFAITPDTGYNVLDLKVDEKSVGAVSQYAFLASGNQDGQHTIIASFAKKPVYTVFGKVTSEGVSIANCSVYLAFSENQYTALTNSEGSYTFTNLPALSGGALWANAGEDYEIKYYNRTISTIYGNVPEINIELNKIYKGEIKGKITYDAMKSKNPGVSVQAFDNSTKEYLTTTTDDLGNYSIKPVKPGNYWVFARDEELSTDFYYSERGTVVSITYATYIIISENSVKNSIDITVSSGGTIHGTVYLKNDSGNKPLANAIVNAISIKDQFITTTKSDSSGNYTITGLSFVSQYEDYTNSGYHVEVPSVDYQYQAYNMANKINDAQPLYTGIGNINFYLISTVSIAGIVTGPPNTTVDIIVKSQSSTGEFSKITVIISQSGSATYSISGLKPKTDYSVTVYPSNYPVASYTGSVDLSHGSQSDIAISINKGTALSGIVKAENGDAISGITVSLYSNNALYRETISSSSGQYTLVGLSKQTYSLNVNNSKYLPLTSNVTITADETQNQDIILKQGYNITGKVSYNQNAVPGIRIEAALGNTYRTTTINESDGLTYTLTGLMPGIYKMTVSGTTYQTIVTEKTIVDQDVTANFSLMKSYRSISGYIYNMFKDENATIRAWSANGSEKSMKVKANYDNEPIKFKIDGLLSADNYYVEVKSDKHPLHFYKDKFGIKKANKLNLSEKDATDLVFALVKAYMIKGTISIPAFPADVKKTEVLVYAFSELTGGEGIANVTFSEPGSQSYVVQLLIESNDYLVSVQSYYYVNQYFDNARESNATKIDTAFPVPVDFTLTGGKSIAGKVTDTDGNPQNDLLVFAWSQKTGSRGSTHTDSNGDFIVRGLVQSDDFIVQVFNKNNVTFFYNSQQTVRTQKQATTLSTMVNDVKDIQLAIRTVQKLTGQVKDTNNSPISGVLVTAESEITMSDGSAFTDKNGYFTIGSVLAGNDYTVKAGSDEWISQEKLFVSTDTNVDFILDHKLNYTIQGNVINETGRIVTDAKVELWSQATQNYVGNPVLTDKTGAYKLIADNPGSYTIMVTPRSITEYCFTTYGIELDRNITVADIIMKQAYSISGTVIYADNTAVSGATVLLRSASQLLAISTLTDNKGAYRFANIPNASDYVVTVVPVTGVGKEETDVSPGSDADFILYRSSYIEGSITAKSTGLPITHASVEVYSKSKPNLLGFSEFSYSDEKGFYRFNSLRVNDDNGNRVTDYIVVVSSNGYVSGTAQAKKTGDTVDISLEQDNKKTTQITGKITSSVTYDVFIVALMKGGTSFERFTKAKADGSFEFNGLNSNRQYLVSITPYIGKTPQADYTDGKLYNTGDNIVITYSPSRQRDLRYQQRTSHDGEIISLKSLTHSVNTISNITKISFNWDFTGFETDIRGYYTSLDQSASYTFTTLDVLDMVPITQRVFTSQQILTEYEIYYFHIAPVFTDGYIGKTYTVGPYTIDTIAPSNVNVIAPNLSSSLKITVKTGAIGAYEMYISPYNFGEGGVWEPFTQEKEWTLFDIEGRQTIYIQLRDRAGNITNTLAESYYEPSTIYTIRTVKTGLGKISPTNSLTGEVFVTEGNNQTLIIEADAGYIINSSSADNEAVELIDNTYTFYNVNSDHDFEIDFRQITHQITVSSGLGGCIQPDGLSDECNGYSPRSGIVNVDHGNDSVFTVKSNSNYKIKSVTADGESLSLANASDFSYTFTQVISDHRIAATFEKKMTSPQISPVADVTMDENNESNPIGLTFSDAETQADNLTLEFDSNKTDLIPKANIKLKDRNGQTAKITLTPVANKYGNAEITVKVTDEDNMSAITKFTLTVKNVSYPPTISLLKDATIEQNGIAGPYDITVSNQDSGALRLTALTSNPTLVSNDRIFFIDQSTVDIQPFNVSVSGGVGYNLKMRIEPVTGQSGNALITITVANPENQTASSSFELTVSKTDNKPVLSFITNRAIYKNSSTGKIAFTVSDPDGGILTLTGESSSNLVTPSGIVFSNGSQSSPESMTVTLGSPVGYTLALYATVTPEKNMTGQCNITIKAVDSTSLSDKSIFALTVKEPETITKTWYGFAQDDSSHLGINDTFVTLIEDNNIAYSAVTKYATSPDGKSGDGYFGFELTESNDIYKFKATKSGYYPFEFNSADHIDSIIDRVVAFKPIYMSTCESGSSISVNLKINGDIPKQPIMLYLIAKEAVQYSSWNYSEGSDTGKYEICVNSLGDYTLIASIADYYTRLNVSGASPITNVNLNLTAIEKVDLTPTGTEVVNGKVVIDSGVGGEIIPLFDKKDKKVVIIETKVVTTISEGKPITISFKIFEDKKFDNNPFTIASNQTLIQTEINEKSEDFVYELSIQKPANSTIEDFKTGKYKIYVAATEIDLLEGRYSEKILPENILFDNKYNNMVTFETKFTGVFGIGVNIVRTPCVTCDEDSNAICFISSMSKTDKDRNESGMLGQMGILGVMMVVVFMPVIIKFMKRNRKTRHNLLY